MPKWSSPWQFKCSLFLSIGGGFTRMPNITMVFYLCFLLWVLFVLIDCEQFYDSTDCSSVANLPGSRYTCNSGKESCPTFIVYRANNRFNTISGVSSLFEVDAIHLLGLNSNLTTSSLEILPSGKDIIVPVTCSCTGNVSEAKVSYIVSNSTPPLDIACEDYEGLLKSQTLIEENEFLTESEFIRIGSKLNVPLRCACPDNVSISNGVKYLVTYPFIAGDGTRSVSKKFGIRPEDLWVLNHLGASPTVYPRTTVLIPLKAEPVIFSFLDSPPPAPGFIPTVTVEKKTKKNLKNVYIAVSVVGFVLIVVLLIACVLYLKTIRKWKGEKLDSLSTIRSPFYCSTPKSSPISGQTARNSTNSCLSPDLLVGIKYSLSNYSTDDIKRATNDFSKQTKVGDEAYQGLLDNIHVLIKEMRFEDTRQIIDVHSKINHFNILILLGVCYGENDFSSSYIVFELPVKGCLRDCLSNTHNPPKWRRRMQIAFDIANGLHYLHHCIFPSYAHMKVNTQNIFVTENWRAKLANIEIPNEKLVVAKGWIAPEYLTNSSSSEKVDIFAFGVVLFELISGKENMDGYLFRDSIGFLGGAAGEGGCFEQLRSFMDPTLKDEYPLAEALCLAVLAKACVAEDPLHRPSMDDIIKVLNRMV